jgi:hypothetical protein
MEELIGSVSNEDFILGLLSARGVETSGDVWETLMDCNHCKFTKQCQELGGIMEQQGKNPRCGQIVDMLLGELKPEDIPVTI